MSPAILGAKVTCVLLLGLALSRALRRRPAALRHAVLVATVLASALVPLTGLVAPTWLFLPRAEGAPATGVVVTEAMAIPAPTRAGAGGPDLDDRGVAGEDVLLGLWGLASLVALLRVCRRLRGVRTLRRTSPPLDDRRWTTAVAEMSALLGVHSRVTLRAGVATTPVVTWGWLRPQLLVPSTARQWTDEQVRLGSPTSWRTSFAGIGHGSS